MKKVLCKISCLFTFLLALFTVVSCDKDSNIFKVEFNVQGHGIAPEAQEVVEGEFAVEPDAPTDDSYDFKGWFKESDCVNEYSFSTEPVTADIVLYAKWAEKTSVVLKSDATPTIYLAGDSTVQSYADTQYIAGWGQYLGLFLKDNVNVVNAARGGRSSRSFINEDRLFKSNEATTYSFKENNEKSIEETIKEGDFLFIQFGHNDDNTKGYTTMPDRMVPLGTPDANGVYPTTAPTEKKSTTYLPSAYINQATAEEKAKVEAEIAKYGNDYYAYGDGTYKWYLKQFIDLARSKGATPVLLTPVARVSFDSNGNIKSGAGLHGENFAYVKAVRQLAEEENCLLIDNFNYSKKMLETATKSYADFLMAIVPNELDNGAWPAGYDNAYKNATAGFEKIEATHYNKYGAYLTAAYVAEEILSSASNSTVKGKDAKEYFNFSDNVLITPSSYVDPSNRISISKVSELEGLFKTVKPTNPNRTYKQPSEAVAAIEALQAKGEISVITTEVYETWKAYCAEVRAVYESLNFDYRDQVSNYDVLLEYEAAVQAARPKPILTVTLSANDYVNEATPITVSEHTFSFDSNIEEYAKKGAAFTYNGVSYGATTKSIRLAGNSKITTNPTKYIEFTLTGACSVTIVSTGGDDTRYIQMVNSEKTVVAEYEVVKSQTVNTMEIAEGGTYRIGSKGSNIDVYYIIIEYYA